jgi:hypothetical protein
MKSQTLAICGIVSPFKAVIVTLLYYLYELLMSPGVMVIHMHLTWAKCCMPLIWNRKISIRLMYWWDNITDISYLQHCPPHYKLLLLPYYLYELLMSPGVMVIHMFFLSKMLHATQGVFFSLVQDHFLCWSLIQYREWKSIISWICYMFWVSCGFFTQNVGFPSFWPLSLLLSFYKQHR